MRILKKEEDLMVKLNPGFQKSLFSELIEKYDRNVLSKKFGKSSSILYHYRNNRVNAIPRIVILKAIKLSGLSEKDLAKFTIETFSAREAIKGILKKGIACRKAQIKKELSIRAGAFSLLEGKEEALFLDACNWLKENLWIEKLQKHKGIIKNVTSPILSENNISLCYSVYNKKTKKFEDYSVSIPKRVIFNSDFCYFLGLLYGDGLNGARIGIVNKDRELINWTSIFLKSYFSENKIKSQLSLYQNYVREDTETLSKWLASISDETSIYENLQAKGSYVFNIFITNKILRRILDDFLLSLESLFFKLSFKQKGAFLAGFFDAEGNVNKLDKNLRFSQKIKEKVRAIQAILNKEGYHTRYDGSSIYVGFKKEYKNDLNLFEKQILPYMKQPKKIREVKDLLSGNLMREEYKPILRVISLNSDISQKEIAKFINRAKCHRELNALFLAGLVRKTGKLGESFKYQITSKALEYLEKK